MTFFCWHYTQSSTLHHEDLISLDPLYLDKHKNGLPGINLNLLRTSFSSDISEKPDRYQEADRGNAVLFKQSAMETPIKVVEKGGYCF